MAAGRTIKPHPYISAYLIGREFGIPPHEVLEWDAPDFLRTMTLLSDLTPKGK